jgi:LPXTG-motif cell wall-anchored protein
VLSLNASQPTRSASPQPPHRESPAWRGRHANTPPSTTWHDGQPQTPPGRPVPERRRRSLGGCGIGVAYTHIGVPCRGLGASCSELGALAASVDALFVAPTWARRGPRQRRVAAVAGIAKMWMVIVDCAVYENGQRRRGTLRRRGPARSRRPRSCGSASASRPTRNSQSFASTTTTTSIRAASLDPPQLPATGSSIAPILRLLAILTFLGTGLLMHSRQRKRTTQWTSLHNHQMCRAELRNRRRHEPRSSPRSHRAS